VVAFSGEGDTLRYFFFVCLFAGIFLGSMISLMHSVDEGWREHFVVWGGFGTLGVAAVFMFFYTNKSLIDSYIKAPNNKLLSQVFLGKQKK
jgi:hypothetical protein